MNICAKCGEQMDESDGIYYVVSKIREALGVGGKPMLMGLPRLVFGVVQERNKYRAALEFYAERRAYKGAIKPIAELAPQILRDEGSMARAALAEPEVGEKYHD